MPPVRACQPHPPGRGRQLLGVVTAAPGCWIVDADDHDFADIAEGAPRLPLSRRPLGRLVRAASMVAPVVERAAREYAGQLKVVKVDVDAAPSVAARFEARSIPTLLLLRSGRVVGRQVGAPPGDRLLAWVGAELERETTEHH